MNNRRISLAQGIPMIVVAGAIDFIQFLLTLVPFVGWLITPLISICAVFLFGIWFSHYGVSLFDSKRILGTLGTTLGEMLPIIGALPMWTARVTYTIITERTTEGTL